MDRASALLRLGSNALYKTLFLTVTSDRDRWLQFWMSFWTFLAENFLGVYLT